MKDETDEELKKRIEGMTQEEINLLFLKVIAKLAREHRVLTVLVDSHQFQLQSAGSDVQ